MAGTIEKPKVMDIRHLDMRAIKLVLGRKDKGDSALLGIIAREFEKEGMTVVPAHEYMPDLLSPEGVMTRRQPNEREWGDLKFAWNIAKELGRLDVGQCVVVREGIVAAVEALEGTDETLRRGCAYGGPECTVVKVFKPGQQKEVDLPSLGLDTLKLMAEGKATCMGVEAGKSLFLRPRGGHRVRRQGGHCRGRSDPGFLSRIRPDIFKTIPTTFLPMAGRCAITL